MNLYTLTRPRLKRPGPPRRGRVRDRKYLAWIRRFACAVCLLNRPTEAAHVGRRGLSQKCSDRETIPLCAEHHRNGKDSYHKLGKRFWEHHGLDRDALIGNYIHEYSSSN